MGSCENRICNPQQCLRSQWRHTSPCRTLGADFHEELSQKFSRALFPRTTNQHGYVTLHSYHFYVEAGVPKTRILLWVYGEQLRAVLDHVVLAEYHCRYDWRTRKVQDIILRDAICVAPGSSAAIESAGILGPLSSEADDAPGPSPFSCSAIVALRARENGVESIPQSQCGIQSIYFRTGVTLIMARFASYGILVLRVLGASMDPGRHL